MYSFTASLFIIGLLNIQRAFSLFEKCDQTYYLKPGQTINIASPNYPRSYPPGTKCRYTIKAPFGSFIVAKCYMNIFKEQSGACTSEVLYIVRDNSPDFVGGEYLCGTGNLQRTSLSNTMILAITSDSYNTGSFLCDITQTCDCGWSVNRKIVGGTTTYPNQYISMVGIKHVKTGHIFCGGSIISPRHILTTAHCVPQDKAEYRPPNIAALVGAQTLYGGTKYSAIYLISIIKRHPNFDPIKNHHDIAILNTVIPIIYNPGVGPACLPFAMYLLDGAQLEVPGFGTTSFAGSQPQSLQTVTLTTISNNLCIQKGMKNIINEQVCTYLPGKDTCQYDSGSSLYYRSDRLYALALVSYGKACASSSPAVNTRITPYIPWIQSNTPGANFCKI